MPSFKEGTTYLAICPLCFKSLAQHRHRDMLPKGYDHAVIDNWLAQGFHVRLKGEKEIVRTDCKCGNFGPNPPDMEGFEEYLQSAGESYGMKTAKAYNVAVRLIDQLESEVWRTRQKLDKFIKVGHNIMDQWEEDLTVNLNDIRWLKALLVQVDQFEKGVDEDDNQHPPS